MFYNGCTPDLPQCSLKFISFVYKHFPMVLLQIITTQESRFCLYQLLLFPPHPEPPSDVIQCYTCQTPHLTFIWYVTWPQKSCQMMPALLWKVNHPGTVKVRVCWKYGWYAMPCCATMVNTAGCVWESHCPDYYNVNITWSVEEASLTR